jgi:hypothetical protein
VRTWPDDAALDAAPTRVGVEGKDGARYVLPELEENDAAADVVVCCVEEAPPNENACFLSSTIDARGLEPLLSAAVWPFRTVFEIVSSVVAAAYGVAEPLYQHSYIILPTIPHDSLTIS